jgi:hypothetical protein
LGAAPVFLGNNVSAIQAAIERLSVYRFHHGFGIAQPCGYALRKAFVHPSQV